MRVGVRGRDQTLRARGNCTDMAREAQRSNKGKPVVPAHIFAAAARGHFTARVRLIFRRLFGALGHLLVIAGDGLEALSVARIGQPFSPTPSPLCLLPEMVAITFHTAAFLNSRTLPYG